MSVEMTLAIVGPLAAVAFIYIAVTCGDIFAPFTSAYTKICAHQLTAGKDQAYAERNMVVALAAKMAKYLGYTLIKQADMEEPGWWIIFIELPAGGQVSWHVKDSELENFPEADRILPGNYWDGHSTTEKYDRVKKYISAWLE